MCHGASAEEARALAESALSSGSALAKAREWIEAQGGDIDAPFPKAKTVREIRAKKDGYISKINAEGVGTASMLLGAGRATMESFIDYFAFELYIHNEDSIFENNNWRLWRVRTADGATPWSDGKWRIAVYDTDFSTGIYDGPDSASTDNISERLTAASEEEYQQNNLRYKHSYQR